MPEANPKKPLWGMLELMGHQKIAGLLSEENFGGNFIRVDVPEIEDIPGYTKLIGNSAIFAVTFLSEEVARQLVATLRSKPIQPWELNASRALQYTVEADPEEEDFDF